MITHPYSSSAKAHRPSRLLWSATVATVAAGALTPLPRDAAAADAVPGGAVVTGTHIRGSSDSAFPITIYNRDVIESSGASTLQVVANGIPSIGVSITVTP